MLLSTLVLSAKKLVNVGLVFLNSSLCGVWVFDSSKQLGVWTLKGPRGSVYGPSQAAIIIGPTSKTRRLVSVDVGLM